MLLFQMFYIFFGIDHHALTCYKMLSPSTTKGDIAALHHVASWPEPASSTTQCPGPAQPMPEERTGAPLLRYGPSTCQRRVRGMWPLNGFSRKAGKRYGWNMLKHVETCWDHGFHYQIWGYYGITLYYINRYTMIDITIWNSLGNSIDPWIDP